jgi:hypothetical protein
MARFFLTAIIALLGVAGAAAGDHWPGRTIDLDKPGTLEALQRDNPAHYEKIHKIMDGLATKPHSKVPGWIQEHFNVRNVSYVNVGCAPILLTTDPPKKRISFTLEGTRYRALVTLTGLKTKIRPAE